MSLFRCCFGKSKKKDPDVVKTSTIKKNLTLCGEIDWNVLNFDPRDKIWTNETSRDFIFFFPEADKFFKFALELKPIHDCRRQPYSDAHLYFINRNSEDLKILITDPGCCSPAQYIKAEIILRFSFVFAPFFPDNFVLWIENDVFLFTSLQWRRSEY